VILGLFVVMVALRLAAAMRMALAADDKFLVRSRVQRGQLLQEGRHVPYELIVHAAAPSGHAAGLDAVLDHPERLSWSDRLFA